MADYDDGGKVDEYWMRLTARGAELDVTVSREDLETLGYLDDVVQYYQMDENDWQRWENLDSVAIPYEEFEESREAYQAELSKEIQQLTVDNWVHQIIGRYPSAFAPYLTKHIQNKVGERVDENPLELFLGELEEEVTGEEQEMVASLENLEHYLDLDGIKDDLKVIFGQSKEDVERVYSRLVGRQIQKIRHEVIEDSS